MRTHRPAWGGIFKHRPMHPSRGAAQDVREQQQRQWHDRSTASGAPSAVRADSGISPHAQHGNSSRSVWKPWTWLGRRVDASDGDASCGACSGCCQEGASTSGSHLQRCRQGFTEAGLPLSKFAAASFDTVVDAFGLCSHEDPVQVCGDDATSLGGAR